MRFLTPLFFLFVPVLCFSQFEPESIITISGSNGTMVRTFDCDTDGDQDVVAASAQGVILFKNRGSGEISTPFMLKKNGASALDAADFDGDNNSDIVVANQSMLFLIHNNGNGTFAIPDTVYQASYLQDFNTLVAADLDGDGDQDILTSSPGLDRVYWYENNGTGAFTIEHEIAAGFDPSAVFASDIDNDGDNDVVYSLNSSLFWVENLGNGVFDNGTGNPQVLITSSLQNVSGIFVNDLDNDGDEDILAASSGNSTIVWFRNDSGTFTNSFTISTTATFVLDVKASDVDGDGDMDVIYGAQYESGWHENLGSGNFGPEIQISGVSGGAVRFISLADLDNDSDEDLVAICTTGLNQVVSFTNNSGTFGPANTILGTTMDVRTILPMDIDNDGDQDLVTSSYTDDKIAFYENRGNGEYSPQRMISSLANGPEKVISADIDGDQLPDLISASSLDNKIAWHKNTGGQFAPEQVISSVVTGIKSIDAGDLDNDGDIDIAAAFESNDRYIWFENLGGGTFSAIKYISNFNVINNPKFVRIADMDGDGIKDVVGGGVDANSPIIWYKKNGASWIPHQISNGIEFGTQGLHVADLDNDGDNDLVVPSGYNWNTELVWYENQGTGSFSTRKLISNELYGVCDAKLVDLDLDGDIDIITSTPGSPSNGLCWFENNGNDQFIKRPFASGNFFLVSVTDVDNDGDSDVFSAESAADKISLHKNNVLAPFQARGNFYIDANQNGQRDNLEMGFALPNITSTPNDVFHYTFDNGRYSVDFDPSITANYELTPSNYNHWGITSDSLAYNVAVNPAFIYKDSLDFGFYPTDLFDSLTLVVAGEFPRCNSYITYWLSINNDGTTHPSGIMEFVLDSTITFVSASITPDSISSNHYYWHYDSLDWFSSTGLQLQVQLPDFNAMGDTLTSYLNAFSDTASSTGYLLSKSFEQIVVCAYDPNDKTAEPMGFGPEGFILPDVEYIDYTIRFQNTGNDTSITVVIRDQLDTNFVWNSLSTLASSHPVETTINAAGELVFNFEQIYLPDSIVNEPASHGFVKYRIWLKEGLPIGTSLQNTANIYFDYNPAVITNTTVHTLYECQLLGLQSITTFTCEGTDLLGTVNNALYDNITWKINGVFDIHSDEFTWHADTSGIFNLQLIRSNPYCYYDTTILITVSPVYEQFIDSLQICSGETIEVFGNLEMVSGNYYNTLSSAQGCDSVLVINLQVNPNPLVEIASFLNDTICVESGSSITLPNAVPVGGLYIGNGVNGNSFNPVIAGTGTHLITYMFEDSLGCDNSDFVTITVETCLSIDENPLQEWNIYPNPVNDQLFIETAEGLDIMIVDMTGKIIQSDTLKSGKNELNVSLLTNGVYLILSESGSALKFVKQ